MVEKLCSCTVLCYLWYYVQKEIGNNTYSALYILHWHSKCNVFIPNWRLKWFERSAEKARYSQEANSEITLESKTMSDSLCSFNLHKLFKPVEKIKRILNASESVLKSCSCSNWTTAQIIEINNAINKLRFTQPNVSCFQTSLWTKKYIRGQTKLFCGGALF